MNEQRPDTALDDALRRWADSQQETDLDGLQQRILTAWREETSQDPVTISRPSTDTGRSSAFGRRPAVWFTVGAVAAAVVAMGLFSFLVPRNDDGSGMLPPEFAWLQNGELAEKVVLADELDRLFGSRFEWIGETNGHVLLEVRQNGLNGEHDSRRSAPLAVRVVAVRRGAGEDRWTPVWAADVVTRQEQLVHLAPDTVDSLAGADFSLWAYALEDGVIAVDSELSLGELPLKSTFSGLQRTGVPVAVHAVEQGAVQYRVFQTVVVLDSEA